MTTKTKTTKAAEPKITTIEKDVSLPFHADHCMVLTVKTVMTKYPKQKATFDHEMYINNAWKGYAPDVDIAAQRLYELARIEIHERRMLAEANAEVERQRALVELEVAAGVPEAIEEVNKNRAQRRVIAHIPFTDQFGLYLNGSSEPLITGGSYSEVDHAAKAIEQAIPF